MARLNTKRDTQLSTAPRRVRRTPRRRDVSPAAYQRLREFIATGRLAPGATLIEADLSKRLGVSRTPIREALLRLQQEGFVNPSPVGQTRRPIVAPLTSLDLTEVFQIAGAFEATAARAAAGLSEGRREALALLLAEASAGLQAAVERRPPDVIAADAETGRFHRAIAEAGAGPRLRAELDGLYPQVARYGRAYGPAVRHAAREIAADQRAIIAALRAGSGDRAEQCVAAHWRRWLERFRAAMDRVGEQGTW